jgi:hypothetical protein
MIINKLLKNKTYGYVFFISIFLVLNFKRLFSPYANLEWTFIELSKFLHDSSYYYNIMLFKQDQANSTFYSLIISKIFYFKNLRNNLEATQILVRSFPLILLFLIIYKIKNYDLLKNFEKFFLLFFLLFSPFYTVYFFRIYPDINSVLLALLSVIYLTQGKIFFCLFTFTICLILKPVAVIIIPLLIYIRLSKYIRFNGSYNQFFNKKNYILIFKNIFCFAIPIIVYFFYIIFFEKNIFDKKIYDLFFNFSINNSIGNFLRYLIYFNILTGPILILIVIKAYNHLSFKIILLCILFSLIMINFLSYSTVGELNFSYLDKFLNSTTLKIINCFFLFLTTLISYYFLKNNNNLYKSIYLLYLFIFIICSIIIYRPAQRYGLYIYPIYIILISIFLNQFYNKNKIYIFLVFNFIYFFIINYLQFVNANNKYFVNEITARYIINNKLADFTHPGIIGGSHGYLFKNYNLTRYDSNKYLYYITDLCSEKNFKYFYHLNYKICILKN